ncbi:MAG: extracellular solute-binding protein, partial [Actinomycetes bacterium]
MTASTGSRVRAAVAAALVLPLSALGACSDSEGSSGSGAATTIRVQVSGEPEETKVYESVAAAFEKANPGKHVQVVAVPEKSDHLARLTTSFASGNPPDVFLVNFREYTQFEARGAVEAVGPRLEKAGVDLADYYEQPVEAFTYRGALQCMPQNISSLVVYVNRQVFADAGAAEPAAGWSWDDFARTAAQLTRGDVRGAGIDASLIRLAPFVWSAGGEVVDDLEQPTRLTLDEPRAREAVSDIVELVRSGAVPTEEEIAAQDLQTRFVTGKLGMLLSSRREVPALREVDGLDFDVAPVPVRDRPATI